MHFSKSDFLTADLETNVRKPEFRLVHPAAGQGERDHAFVGLAAAVLAAYPAVYFIIQVSPRYELFRR